MTEMTTSAATAALRREMENLSGALDTPAVRYFLARAIEAEQAYVRAYWLRRKSGAEAMARRLAGRARRREIEAGRAAAISRLRALPAPAAAMENKWPNGAIVRWTAADNWDGFHVLCRKPGTAAWRSVATKNVNRLTRDMAVPVRYMKWGDEPPYEICVRAMLEGAGVKESNILVYDRPGSPPEPAPAPAPARTREEVIVEAMRTYEGPRTVWRRMPYLRNLRRHAGLPDITSRERRRLWAHVQQCI